MSAMISPLIGGVLFDHFGHITTFDCSMFILLTYFIIFVFGFSGIYVFKEDKDFRFKYQEIHE